ncbi:MAG: hypothetical protein IIT63_14885, partial [Prevotella sp.]|nr:hypothetical protein [Prevotella sp.]
LNGRGEGGCNSLFLAQCAQCAHNAQYAQYAHNAHNAQCAPYCPISPKRPSNPFVEACDNHYAQMLLWVCANLFSIDYNWLIVEKKHKTEQIVGYLVFLPYLCTLFYNNIRKNQN